MQIEKKAIFLTATINDCSIKKKKNNPLKGPEERRRNLRETAWPASFDYNLKKK